MLLIKKTGCTILFYIIILLIPGLVKAQPQEVSSVLKKAGKNRPELEKAITYFKKTGDPLQLKAIYFLIAHMDIHHSEDYYWVNQAGKKVEYNELLYADFNKALQAFELIKKRTPGIHPQPVSTKDIETIKAGFLIRNIEAAFKSWKNSAIKNVSFKDFCEYILPYRASVEPLQDWREAYEKKFNWIPNLVKTKGLAPALGYVTQDYKLWFTNTFTKESRKEPLPRLGALQLLLRKNGPCEDIADLEVFTLRSQGIPVALDIIPYWGTSTNSHFVNAVFSTGMRAVLFDISRSPSSVNTRLVREPAKVIRVTYSKQPGVLASFERKENIPDGFMRTQNYIDVTHEYCETVNITCKLFPSAGSSKIAYASIFNGMRWKPAWWGKINNDEVTFKSMSPGVLCLPGYYQDGKIKPAGYPVAIVNNQKIIIAPNLNQKRNIIIAEQDGYLKFRAGKKYKLFYWDNSIWKLSGIQIAAPYSTSIMFSNVPGNALLLLVPEYSEQKERPFIIHENGQRQWF